MKHYQERLTASKLCFFVMLAVYLTLRIIAWKNTVLFEDTDSLFYLDNIKTFLTFDLRKIIDLHPLSTPFYPFFGSLLSLPGWSIETGARLTSLILSTALFAAVWGIGRHIAKPLGVTLGLLILAFNPYLISLSFAVLTEPSYIALIYIGFWIFWVIYKNPKPWQAAILGCIFGLAFLDRTEGILYLIIIPFLQATYMLWEGRKTIEFRKIVYCGFVFVACFSFLAIPQIWRVSHKVGSFEINGRQIWARYLSIADGKSQVEKLFGLNFSPSMTNIGYITANPSVLKRISNKAEPVKYIKWIKKIISNLDQLYRKKLGSLIGPIGFMFFGFGLISLYQSGNRFEIFLIILFIILNLFLASLPSYIKMRYVIIVAPFIFLLEGIGIVFVSNFLLANTTPHYLLKYILPPLFLLILTACWIVPLHNSFRPPIRNSEYSPSEIKKPVSIIKNITVSELHRPPKIIAQRRFISYYSDGIHYYLPFTDYESLIKYCDLNNIDFVYLKYNRLKRYPFQEAFLNKRISNNLKLIYSGVDAYGGKIELYRFKKAT